MAPLFSQDMVFEVAGLKSLKNQLSVPTPETKAHGNLEGWSYIILENLPGESIRRVWTGHLEYELLAPAVFRNCGPISYFPNEIAQTKGGDFSKLADMIFPL